MNLQSNHSTVNIRLLRPGFEYPEGSFKHRDALYYPFKDIVFIATKVSSGYEDAGTEVAIWEPDEIRLIATLTLSVPENGGWVGYIPLNPTFTAILTVPDLPIPVDLSSDDTISCCLDCAYSLLVENQEKDRDLYILRSQQSLPRSDAKTEKELFENIDLTNSLLIRGLYHLIKCPLLISMYPDYPMFLEEAFINLQISNEAAIQIIQKRLSIERNSHTSKKDVFEYINSHFTQGISWVEYLEEQYEKWIKTKHPMSVYGSRWAPSLWADDIYETYGTLISIYRHIVLGEQGGSSARQI